VNELLTQFEIDELLASIQEGTTESADLSATETSDVRSYDFRTAKRVSRDQLKTLHVIYENYSMLLSTYLTGTLGFVCDTSIVSIEEQSYIEFVNSVTPSSVLAILKMPPLKGPLLLRLSPELSYSILDCLLGGMNSPGDSHRLFTEIDLVILEKIIRHFLLLNNEAWEKILAVNTLLEGLETSVQFAQIVPPSETILIITLSVRIMNNDALVNLCIPYPAIEPIAKELNTRLIAFGQNEKTKIDHHQEEILSRLHYTQVTLKAILSETTIRIEDLMNLQVGDVVQLDNKLDDLIKIDIGHISRLSGILGEKANHYAIKITQINDAEDDSDG